MPKTVKKRRNTLAKGASSKKKLEYQRKYNASKKEKRRRAKLNKANRNAGTYGNKDKKDVSHCKTGYVMEKEGKNRARRGKKKGKCVKKLPRIKHKK
jgi:hypothetical protein